MLVLWWCVGVGLFAALVEAANWLLNRTRPAIASYAGLRVVVTGASSGIGRELAVQYASRGCRLLLCARRAELLAEVRADCLRLGSPEVGVLPTDVTDVQQCQALVAEAERLWDGGIDLLVLNAGRSCIVEFGKAPLDAVASIMELNCYGCFYVTWYALPALRRSRGRIVVVSSVAGITWPPLRTVYSASKHALAGFYNALRLEEPDVAVTIAYPAYVVSEIHDKAITEKGVVLQRKIADHFMPTDVCARIIIEGAHVGARDILLEPYRSRLIRWLAALLPDLLDIGVKRVANQALGLST